MAGDEEHEGDTAAAAGGAVFEDGDAGDATKSREDGVEIGVGEVVVEVGDVDGGFGGRETAGAAAGAAVVGGGGCGG